MKIIQEDKELELEATYDLSAIYRIISSTDSAFCIDDKGDRVKLPERQEITLTIPQINVLIKHLNVLISILKSKKKLSLSEMENLNMVLVNKSTSTLCLDVVSRNAVNLSIWGINDFMKGWLGEKSGTPPLRMYTTLELASLIFLKDCSVKLIETAKRMNKERMDEESLFFRLERDGHFDVNQNEPYEDELMDDHLKTYYRDNPDACG